MLPPICWASSRNSRFISSDLTIANLVSRRILTPFVSLAGHNDLSFPQPTLLPDNHLHLPILDTILCRIELSYVTKDLYAISGPSGNTWAPEQLKRFAVVDSELLGADARIVRRPSA